VRAAEDGEQRFGLLHRLRRILGWFREERALVDEHLHREAAIFAYEETSEVAQRPERSDENSRRGVAVVRHCGKRRQYARVRADCHDTKQQTLSKLSLVRSVLIRLGLELRGAYTSRPS
jgi:hypothetical protein